MAAHVQASGPFWAKLVGGTDLTGDDRFANSDVFSGGLLLEMMLIIANVFFLLEEISFTNGPWESLVRFLFIIAWCFMLFPIAGVISLGNNSIIVSYFGRFGVLLSLVLLIFWYVPTLVFLWRDSEESAMPESLVVTLQVGHGVAMILMVGSLFFPLIRGANDGRPMLLYLSEDGRRGCGEAGGAVPDSTEGETGDAVAVEAEEKGEVRDDVHEENFLGVLPASSELQWDRDDLLGFECAAGIPREGSFFHRPNHSLLVGPDMVKCLMSYAFPRPFDLHHKFPSVERRRLTALRAHINYPVRLLVALICTALFCSSFAVVEFVNAYNLEDWWPGIPTYEEILLLQQDLQDAETWLDSEDIPSADGPLLLLTTANMLRWAQENPELAAQCLDDLAESVPTNCTSHLETAYSELLSTQAAYIAGTDLVDALSTDLDELVDSFESWHSYLESVGTVLIVSTALALAITYWFMFVAVLAFRKTLLELSLSSPSFPFSPMVQHPAKDQKFVAIVSVSMVLSFFLLQLVFVSSGLLLTWDVLWETLLDYGPEVVAFCIYQTLVLLVVPKLCQEATLDKQQELVNPRRQAMLVFVWEIFYFPQVVLSVLLRVVFCACTAIGMLLRPDATLLSKEWGWLDSMHCGYVATVYTQIIASQLKVAAG
uniref:Uncharacterized protein n=1 Tax=Noctiluca scintillans TaxID=2966 RepID=A0A7S1FCB9_NOCSC|mmetsp:Transcript_52753/g.140769  ORF Transcript_52753/g.140769 Transcript_52753/m.140769 type:complete len:656 (+) Transcript_52753:26-1993(+)